MNAAPQVRITKYFGGPPVLEKICSIEEAREVLAPYWPGGYWPGMMVVVRDQMVVSYEEFMELSAREDPGIKEYVDVALYPNLAGG